MFKKIMTNMQGIQQSSSVLRMFLCSVLMFVNNPVLAAPQSVLWPIWDKSDEKNTKTVSHQQWQDILGRYLVEENQSNLFDYRGVTEKDNAILKQYISSLSGIDPRTLNQKEQFAYWVNLYNALTVKLILDNYPLSSIKELGGFFSFGPWDDKIVTVASQAITLNDIEHRILRPIWKDPRVHYALNCASLGCPDLLNQAFNTSNTETLLNRGAKQFTNSDKSARIEGNTLTLSSLYDWYGVDFGNNKQEILRHIDTFRKGKKLEGWRGKIKYDYDWRLNQP